MKRTATILITAEDDRKARISVDVLIDPPLAPSGEPTTVGTLVADVLDALRGRADLFDATLNGESNGSVQ